MPDPRGVEPTGQDGTATVGYRLARRTIRILLQLGCRPTVTGAEHVPAEGAVLIAANHLSFIDSIVIPCMLSRRVTFLAKSDYFEGTGVRGALIRTWFEANGAVPVHRTGESDDTQAALRAALDVLHRGWAFGIYPEGTRSRDGRLYRGRTGVAWLALTAGCPVVPVGLVGTDAVLPIGSKVPRPHRIQVRIGPAIHPAHYAGLTGSQARRRLTDDLMAAIAGLTGQARAAGYHEPGQP
jgi:1-acyl-sn-glycerol-3-phosphate acyltransferase